MKSRPVLIVAVLTALANAQTPVIGGGCAMGTQDVQIGGKQTQFFLKCEPTSESPSGEGVWVVKSRAAAAAAAPAPIPLENTQPQHRPKIMHKQPNICEQDLVAREGASCAVSTTCLQAHNEMPSSYLQCEQSKMIWHRRDCHEGTIFNFEQQACIVPKRVHSLSRQVSNSGLVCTYSSCSNNNPCNVGSCNNGYCCSSSSSIPQIMSTGSSNCIGCGASPQVVQIPQIAVAVCPNGGYSSGSCGYGNSCNSGYSCNQGSCCPTYQAQAVTFTCPGGGSPVGSCVNGGCASGYSCSSNYCCASSNPFVCIDGTQAVGSCVNGVCGTGYTCNSGLCCSTTSATPRCLDGSPAVGACIPSCTGDMCGGVTVTYSCGSGYTCTTGNICCQTSACPLGGTPIGPPVNGLCPGGYTLQGNQCCGTANQCTNGGTYVGELINGLCPPGSVANNGVCCTSAITCDAAASNGPCLPNQALSCSVGYQCDTTGQLCCPILTNIDPNTVDSIGPALFGCPLGYFAITFAGGDPSGECVNVQSLPGICTAAQQIGPCNVADATCPAGFECHLASQTCCQPGTFTNTAAALAFRSHPGGRFGRPVSHLMPPRTMGTHGCPDGSPAASACINGLCGAGLSCLNDLCCAVNEPVNVPKSSCPDGTPAVSGCFADGLCGGGLVCVPGSRLCCPASSVPTTPAPAFPYGQSAFMKARPIGARCDSDQHCVGFTDGLSHCEFGTCRCTPIAYAQGIACVRRKKL